ncbi:MAG TPA: hypothetical protein VHN55_07480, partial [Sphingomicrobium sp.]|nr:hypothetical protein [Sphingomicrobium sp.]
RFAVERLAVDFLAAGFFAVERFAPVEAAPAPPVARCSSIGHLPDMIRCAASDTASAISAPSLVALDITDFAALSALSAASIPASLIALRAFGLALIAAAAAARPAASISLLIAALAIFSPVDFDELEEDDLPDFELLPLLDFAIAIPPFQLARLDKRAKQQFRCGSEKAMELQGPKYC